MIFEMKRLLYQTYVESTLHIYPVFPYTLQSDAIYTASIQPVTGFRMLDQARKGKPLDSETRLWFDSLQALSGNGDALALPIIFPQEDEYALTVYVNGRETDTLRLLALDADLFARFPYKGNMRLHSFYSDGIGSPEWTAAQCRMRGLDFAAIADPTQYAPSKRAASFLSPLGVDFLPIRGEEIRIPDSPFPIVAVGHSSGICEWRRRNIGYFEEEVEKNRASITEPLSGRVKFALAAIKTICQKIRELRGVSILALPERLEQPGTDSLFDISDVLFAYRSFDAFELFSDTDDADAWRMVGYYQENRAAPVVGGSRYCALESARDHILPYTIVFAARLTEESILRAIRDGYAVAVRGDCIIGPTRLVSAAYFFMRRVFPQHDALCASQGRELVLFAGGKAETDPDFSDRFLSIGELVSTYYEGLKG